MESSRQRFATARFMSLPMEPGSARSPTGCGAKRRRASAIARASACKKALRAARSNSEVCPIRAFTSCFPWERRSWSEPRPGWRYTIAHERHGEAADRSRAPLHEAGTARRRAIGRRGRATKAHRPPRRTRAEHVTESDRRRKTAPLLMAENVVIEVRLSRREPIFDGVARPDREVSAVIALVPALAARLPHGAFRSLLEIAHEGALNVGADIHRFVGAQSRDALGGVACLRLDHEDHRVVSETGVRSHQKKHVRKAG